MLQFLEVYQDPRKSALIRASSTRGSLKSWSDSARQDVIDYVTIASEGNAIDFGNLIEGLNSEPCSTSSSTRGIWCGGYKNRWIF